MSDAPLLVLGCGYVGTRLAVAARRAGRTVRVAGRSTGRLAPLQQLGIEVKFMDVAMPKQITAAVASLHGATVVYSIPPASSGPPGTAIRNSLQAAYSIGASSFIYFSSSGMYGAAPDDDAWIDEDTPVVIDDPPMHGVQNDERMISESTYEMRTVVLRLAPVYGGGRGVRVRMQKGEYKLLDDGQHAISRIHVDDVVKTVFAVEDRAPPGKSLFLVADDEPTTQRDYATWLSNRLGLPMPASRAMYESGSPRIHRNRRIKNTRLKSTLGLTLDYPTFREGEAQIEEELARE